MVYLSTQLTSPDLMHQLMTADPVDPWTFPHNLTASAITAGRSMPCNQLKETVANIL